MYMSTDAEAMKANGIKSAVHKVMYPQSVSGQQQVFAEPQPWGHKTRWLLLQASS
jgi:hypothetical protein